MITCLKPKTSALTAATGIARALSQISAGPLRRICQATGLAALVLVTGACGSSLAFNPDGAATSCDDIQQAYADALLAAQQCTVGAADQCGVQVRAGFFCDCKTWVNGSAPTLSAIASQYQAAGCRSVCNGLCVQPQSLVCQADTTSATGGRCKPPALLNLTDVADGGTFPVPVGYEIDILLQDIGPNGYDTRVVLSSDAVTVLEITIPAGPVNPAGPMHLYRLRALSPGEVLVEIPRLSLLTPDASYPSFMITLDIN